MDQLKKYTQNRWRPLEFKVEKRGVILWSLLYFKPWVLDVDPKLTYEKRPMKILDQKGKVLRNKVVPLVKVLWRNQAVEEATWETETDMRERYLELF